MKDIRPALRALLLADPTVNGLVGGVRIYPIMLPQGQRQPSVVYHRVAATTDYQMNGSSALVQELFQFDAWAATTDDATRLGNAVYDVFNGMKGLVTVGSDTLDIKGIFLSSGRDLFDDPSALHRLSRDFSVWYWER